MKNAILTIAALIISIMGANTLAPIFFGPDLQPGDEATGIAILIFAALWFAYRVARITVWESIAAKTAKPAKRSKKEDAEINLTEMMYMVHHQEVLERRGETC